MSILGVVGVALLGMRPSAVAAEAPADAPIDVYRILPIRIDGKGDFLIFDIGPSRGPDVVAGPERNDVSRSLAGTIARLARRFIDRLERKDATLDESFFDSMKRHPNIGDDRTRSLVIVPANDPTRVVATLSFSGTSAAHPEFQSVEFVRDLDRSSSPSRADAPSPLDIRSRINLRNGVVPAYEDSFRNALDRVQVPEMRLGHEGFTTAFPDRFRDPRVPGTKTLVGEWIQLQAFGVDPESGIDFVPMLFYLSEQLGFAASLASGYADHYFLITSPSRTPYYRRKLGLGPPIETFEAGGKRIALLAFDRSEYVQTVAARSVGRTEGFDALVWTHWSWSGERKWADKLRSPNVVSELRLCPVFMSVEGAVTPLGPDPAPLISPGSTGTP